MDNVMTAHFKCNTCGHEWREEKRAAAMPSGIAYVWDGTCKICRSLYSIWLNYGEKLT